MAVLGTAALWLLSTGTLFDALKASAAMAGAAATAFAVPRRPVAAIGIVFLLACFSRLVIELPVGTMRLEQPAIAALLLAVVWHRRRLELPSARPLVPLIAAAALYLGVLTLSSLLVAPEPLASLRMVLWTGASMTAGLIAALLIAGRARSAFPYLVGAGSIVAAIGALAAIAYFLFGPQASLISGSSGTIPKVYSVVHEANLYASLLGALIPLAVEQFRHRATLLNAGLLALLLIAIGLGVTRGAYVGLLVGLVVYFGLRLIHARPTPALRRAALVVVLAGTAGLLVPSIVLNADYAGALGTRPTVDGRPGSGNGSGGQPGPGKEEPRDELATWEYRMQRVNTGLADFRSSPMIGMGAYSYGQRHQDVAGRPETIAVLPVAVLHDAGIIGLAALSGFVAMLGLRAWRASRDPVLGGPASALIASVAVLVVAYVATNALHFAVTWVIIGCAAGATLTGRDEPQPMPVVEGRGAA